MLITENQRFDDIISIILNYEYKGNIQSEIDQDVYLLLRYVQSVRDFHRELTGLFECFAFKNKVDNVVNISIIFAAAAKKLLSVGLNLLVTGSRVHENKYTKPSGNHLSLSYTTRSRYQSQYRAV